MAKRKPILQRRTLKLVVNDDLLTRLAALAADGGGMFGEVHEDAGLIALRAGIKELERQERRAKQYDLPLSQDQASTASGSDKGGAA